MSGLGEKLPAALLLLWLLKSSECSVSLFAPDVVTLEENSTVQVTLTTSSAVNQSAEIFFNVTFSSRSPELVLSLPEEVLFPASSSSVSFPVSSHAVGQVTAQLLSNSTAIDSLLVRIHFLVVHSRLLSLLSRVIGWVYFLAWSVSFYPQAWANWRRKSVVGLNFDFLALNLTGFIAYSVFNVGLFWVPAVKEEFLRRNPNGNQMYL
ncbi:cystinosin-like [Menidia menidia]